MAEEQRKGREVYWIRADGVTYVSDAAPWESGGAWKGEVMRIARIVLLAQGRGVDTLEFHSRGLIYRVDFVGSHAIAMAEEEA